MQLNIPEIPSEMLAGFRAITASAYEVERSCAAAFKDDMLSWELLTETIQASAIARTAFIVLNPKDGPDAFHSHWCAQMEGEGWQYARVIDIGQKYHCDLRPFHHLSDKARVKYSAFHQTILQLIKTE